MIKKLRTKFVLTNMTIVTIMLCLCLALVYNMTRSNLEDDSLHMLQSLADKPLRMNNSEAFKPDSEAMVHPDIPKDDIDNIMLPYFSIEILENGEMNVINSGYFDLSDEELLLQIYNAAYSMNKSTGVLKAYKLRFLKLSTENKQTIIFADISSEMATLGAMLRTCILIGALGFFAFLIISILLSRWAVRPVEKAWEQQKRFVADASHELKTPLTVIITNSELALNDEYTIEEKKGFMGNIRTLSFHMKTLIEQLLELARADNAASGATFMAPLNLSGLICEILLTYEVVLFEKGHTVETCIEEDLMVLGDKNGLSQVAEILLDNAGKYASLKSPVKVSLKKYKEHHVLFSVSNESETIPPRELGNLFKRFYRMDGARKRDGSFGLGLSIAETIVNNHKGKIWAESRNGITSFNVLLKLHVR